MRVVVRPSSSRFVTKTEWLESRHSFSYGSHYDPANIRFGALVAHNDDVLQPGGGFADHPHRDVEIVTWVVSGALRHTDDHGGSGVVRPGLVQRLTAGRGVVHSEVNASDGPTRYLQMWVMPDDEKLPEPPSYELAEAPPGDGEFALVASGERAAPLRLTGSRASLLAARLRAGDTADTPVAELAHVYVVEGAVTVGEAALAAGDAARVSDATGLVVTASEPSTVLVWLTGS